jgi:outer membrane protein OmpA-like peptidoglycan-associated protein
MMRNGAKFLMVAALCGTMSACVGLNPNPSDDLDLYFVDVDSVRGMAPQGTAFAQGLRTGYLELTDYDKSTFDPADASHFARKAVSSAKGLNVQPDAVAYRQLGSDAVDELSAARARLMAGLDGGGRIKAPADAARAQVAYDCWLEAVEANDAPRIDKCKKDFEDAMAAVEQALVPGPEEVYLAFFAWDRADITPVTQQLIDDAAAAYRQQRPAKVVVAGHADRSGPESYNVGLSERRARAVAAALVAQGVPADVLDVQWYGETRPRVPTPDGVREPENRRVEITFEPGPGA